MATIATASSSVFDMVTSTSGAVVSVVNSVAGGATMLNDFVSSQRTKQQLRIKQELLDYPDMLMEQTVINNLKRREEVDRYIAGDPAKAEAYAKEYARISARWDADKAS